MQNRKYMIFRSINFILKALFLLILLVQVGCGSSDPSKPIDKGVSIKDSGGHRRDSGVNQYGDAIPFDFVEKIRTVDEASKIFLQGVERSDSSGPYIIKKYYGEPLTYSMIFYPKNIAKDSVKLSMIRTAGLNRYRDFICFAFVYPMKNPSLLKDYHDSNVSYPISIKSYSHSDGKWTYLSEDSVHNVTELSRFEIRSIYSVVQKH